MKTQVLVVGGGPGGYTAAFRAADLGKQVTLVERYPVLGGVCLNVGCIPSKTLLHVASVLNEAHELIPAGVKFTPPEVNLDELRAWKNKVSSQLNSGLAALAKQRNVTVVTGTAQFVSDHAVQFGEDTIEFEQAIIAVGSQPVKIPSFPNDDPRLMDSTDALELADIPKKLLIVGGGIIGLEMATVYHALGSEITIVEMQDQIIPGCDKDLVRPLLQKIKGEYANIFVETRVQSIEALSDGLKVSFDGKTAPEFELFDKVLVAVGRSPNGHKIAADKAGVNVDERGFIAVDTQQRTNVPHIFAIGDVVGNPMLAHKATHEGKLAAEVIAGKPVHMHHRTIPGIVYTWPELATVGLTEQEVKASGRAYRVGKFPFSANGKARTMGATQGFVKFVVDQHTDEILGCHMIGPNVADLLSEVVLAMEYRGSAEDIGITVHSHPTLSETVKEAALSALGRAIHM